MQSTPPCFAGTYLDRRWQLETELLSGLCQPGKGLGTKPGYGRSGNLMMTTSLLLFPNLFTLFRDALTSSRARRRNLSITQNFKQAHGPSRFRR